MIMTLSVEERNAAESPETLRARGFTPAVFYGPKEKPTPIAIDARKLAAVWKEAGETTIIKLEGAGNSVDTLIKDVQTHPVTGGILHADFYVLEKGKKVEISVPLHFIGEAPAEKLGGIISKALHEIEIEVAPSELPHSLDVDLALLVNLGDHIAASQIKLPPSATLKIDAEEIIASVTEAETEPAQPAEESSEASDAAAQSTQAEA
jgi:large subunit ribosomal protein L25